jgi:diguanylate cyclase (GGDEF)-like protein/PAS domain S-box-containing protein
VTDDAAAFPSDQLLDALEAAVFVFDRDGLILFANRRARRELESFGEPYTPGAQPFAAGLEFLDDHGRPLTMDEMPPVRTLRTGEVITDFVMGARSASHPDVTWYAAATQPLLGANDEIAGVVVTAVDVTGQRDLQTALRTSEERFRLIAENAADVVYRFSVGDHPHFDYMNPAVESALGYTPQEFYDDPALIVTLTHEDDVDQILALGHEGVDGVQSLQLRMVRRDGTQIWTEHKVVPLRNSSGEVVAATGIARDVTALKAKEAFLSHRALHDPLTGLPNRILLLDRLEAAISRIRRHHSHLAVLYLDLDRFKTVNDNLGHECGDRLLQVVGQRLLETLRPSDSVARLGGDEFAAILADLHDAGEAMQVAERLLAVVSEPVDVGTDTIVTTVSIGIASAADGESSAGELLRRADFAMYTAKDRGRHRAEWYEGPDAAPTSLPSSTAADDDDR